MTPFTAIDLISSMDRAYGSLLHPELDLPSVPFRTRLASRWRRLLRLG